MENLNNVEQSETSEINHLENIEVNHLNDNNNESVSDSALGKFKDATSLLAAYDSLQAEFTRKSQRLADAERRLVEFENKSNLSQEVDMGSLAKGNVGAVTENENYASLEQKNNQIQEQNQKLISSQNWKRKVDNFLLEHSDAKDLTIEMANVLRKFSGLRELDNALEISYEIAKNKGLKKPADLIEDPSFIEDIKNNENIKNQIIYDYLQSVKGENVLPKLLSGSSSSIYASPNKQRPKSLDEASKIVSKMFGTK